MQIQSIKVLLAGYLGVILLGTLILSMPPMYHTNVSFLEALFTSVSAMTCTGLAIKNTGLDFTTYGQIVICVLIQLGGFGHMSMAGILFLLIGKRLSAAEKDLINVVDNLNNNSVQGIDKAILKAIVFVLIVELIGASLLCPYFVWQLGDTKEGMWVGIFHAISAFNNSGFTILKDGLLPYQADIVVNLVIPMLIIIGGFGYLSSLEFSHFCYAKVRYSRLFTHKALRMRLSLNTRIVFVMSVLLLICGMINVLIFEWSNPRTLENVPFWDKIMNAFFVSTNYRTSGFNIFDISGFEERTMFFSIFFMMIGGGPGGTAAGIKVTTFAVLVALSIAIVRNRKNTTIFGRTIPQDIVSKAFCVFIIALVYLSVATFFLAIFEPNIPFLPLLFEVVSAFSTVGMSMGDGDSLSLCADFNTIGLLIIMILMISGKIGILAFTLIFMGGARTKHVQYVQEKVLI